MKLEVIIMRRNKEVVKEEKMKWFQIKLFELLEKNYFRDLDKKQLVEKAREIVAVIEISTDEEFREEYEFFKGSIILDKLMLENRLTKEQALDFFKKMIK